MIVTCPACGRKAAVAEQAREVVCDCGRRFDPADRPTVADPFLGRALGGYRIEEVIGSGGMGTVYKAVQLSLDRPVALKVLPPNVADDPQFVRRFHREAEILGALSHPNIVQVIDRGEMEGRWFIVMEYVEGESLRQLMKRGPIDSKQACRIVTAVLAALDYAHQRRIVHRDIKPENILVSPDGVVKVADFGLSRVLGSDDLDTRLTRTHLVLGTYEYMAPEQREASRDADARSDIYAAAVVLYEMLTGELPIGRFALPSERLPGLDHRLDRVIERGLAKDPDDRYARASAMGDELEGLLSDPGAPVDLDAMRKAAGRFASDVGRFAGEVGKGVRTLVDRARKHRTSLPVKLEMRLDLLLTVLSVVGIVVLVAGLFVLLTGNLGGAAMGAYGFLLWNGAERARRYWPGARSLLLVLTAIAVPTVIFIPLTIWTWRLLLARDMRVYFDARHRGLDEREAVALVRGMPLPPRDRRDAHERRRAAVALDRRTALLFGCIALGLWIAAGITVNSTGFRDEGAAMTLLAMIASTLGGLFLVLAKRVRRGRALHFNAFVWTVLGVLHPAWGAQARAVRRDARDKLL